MLYATTDVHVPVRWPPGLSILNQLNYEIGAMRFPCSEIAIEKQILAPTVPQSVHANDLSLEICVFLVVKSLHSLRLLDVLPSLFENVVNSGLTWSLSRWSDSSACSARTQPRLCTFRTPDQIWSYRPLKSPIFHGFVLHGWIRASISPPRHDTHTIGYSKDGG